MKFSKSLMDWYYSQNISFPWRGETDLYKIWVSEIMLQQTQVSKVIKYYPKWIKKFPTVISVANAKEDDILKLWEGLGYYYRAINFYNACKDLKINYDGKLPKNPDIFLKLKGVGQYILSAVYSIGLNEKIPAIDSNVKRFISRYLGLTNKINSELKNIRSFLNREILNISKPGDFNQAMMDFGRLICKPKSPNCSYCSLKTKCFAFKNDLIASIPVKNKKKKKPHYNIVVGIIKKQNKILLCKRNTNRLLGGMWELPNGEIKYNETKDNALKRIFKNFGLQFRSKFFLGYTNHNYSHFSIEQQGYKCEYKSGKWVSKKHSEFRWISLEDKSQYPIHSASHKVLNKFNTI